MLQQNAAVTKLPHRLRVMTDEEHCAPVSCDVFHFSETFFLERRVADREHFIDKKNFRLEMRRYRERQSCVHPRAVALGRRIDELLDLGKAHDLVEAAGNLRAAHSKNRTAQENVLASRELRMKSGSHFEQRSNTTIDLSAAMRRLCNARENF